MIILKEETFNSNFRKWFGKSKVVENGKPLIVYHGSNTTFDSFDPKKIGSHTDEGMWGKGFYFSDEKTAKAYGSKLSAFYLKMENPFIINEYKTTQEMADYLEISEDTLTINDKGLVRPLNRFISQFTSEVKYKGHDGVILYRPISSEYVVFSPTQIKSVNNNGRYNPKSNNVYESM